MNQMGVFILLNFMFYHCFFPPSSAQAQASAGLSLALFAQFTRLAAADPSTQNSKEVAGNYQNLLYNICRSTLVEL
jgi:hypothetical protein